MNIKDLINKLLDFPMDAKIYIREYGELVMLNEDDISLDKDNDVIIES